MPKLECLLFGALGGMCPTISHLAGFYSTKPTDPLPELGVFIGLALFALLGAIIAAGFGAREVKAAIIAGIAAPAIVTNVATGATAEAKRAKPEAVIEGSLLGIAAAYAQSLPANAITPEMYKSNRLVTVTPRIEGGVPSKLDLEIVAIIGDGSGQAEVDLGRLESQTAQTLVLPEGTTALEIGGQPVELPPDATAVDALIETSPTLKGDLLWALGGRRSYEVKDLSLEAK